ncbi:MAG: nucleotidyl transferase AbiEii/AbiGii toxin family protein [Planctomycetaceae bacterium]
MPCTIPTSLWTTDGCGLLHGEFKGHHMSTADPSTPATPMEVYAEFLHSLNSTVSSYDDLVPVLRGSILMKHWFGEAARPAGDVDLEWFPMDRYRSRFGSVVDHARALCMYALYNSDGRQIDFNEDIPIPPDGVSLWEYDTPGLRCYTGWTWEELSVNGLSRIDSGVMQVDLAQAGSYSLAEIVTETIELPRVPREPASFLAYAPEMLLAAKFSWIVRQIDCVPEPDGSLRLHFKGEPKDLFDAHLLLTGRTVRPDLFQMAFLAVVKEDKLDSRRLAALLDSELTIPESDWELSWPTFFHQHSALLQVPPHDMLRTVLTNVRRHLGNVRDHVPFIESIAADPVDEMAYQIYADWLEDHSDARSEFVRKFCRYFFHNDKSELESLHAEFSGQPGAWLSQLLGGSKRVSEIWRRMDAERPGQKPSEEETRQTPSVGTSQQASEKPWWKFW